MVANISRDELVVMFDKARAEGLWFYIEWSAFGRRYREGDGTEHVGWYEPSALEEEYARFEWPRISYFHPQAREVKVFRLRHPREHLIEKRAAADKAFADAEDFAAKIGEPVR